MHLYEEHGADCVRHLHGMFAFSLWDERRQQLLLARDRVGKKPLLYTLRDGVLTLGVGDAARCSQDADIPREVDPVALDRYLAFGYVPAPRTALRGVHKLPPAHTLLFRDGRVDARALLAARLLARSSTRPVEELVRADPRGAARGDAPAADRRRAARRVPVRRDRLLRGRGGDGAALARAGADVLDRLRPRGLRRAAARAPRSPSASAPCTRSSRSAPTRSTVVPQIVRHYGEPFADSSAIPSFYLAELTRRHVTVALNGDGGDESFAGYQRYVANAVAGRLDRHARRRCAARSPPLGGRLPDRGDVSSPLNRARRLAGTLALDAARALRALRVLVRRARSGARSTRRSSRPSSAAPTPTRRSPRAGRRRPGDVGRRPDARGRRRRPTSSTT